MDKRRFLSVETHQLKDCLDLELAYKSDSEEFVRSFGMIMERENSYEVNEKIFAEAQNAFRFDSDNSFIFGSNKRFVPHSRFKRLFVSGVNCRVDVGLKNALITNYSSGDIESIIRRLYFAKLYTPPHSENETSLRMSKLGEKMALLYLMATTKKPNLNFYDEMKDWIVTANAMVLVDAHKYELRSFDFGDYKKIPLSELSEFGIELYYRTSSLVKGSYIPIWLLVANDNVMKDRRRNLRIYLMKLHQERACFKEVLNAFYPAIFQRDNFDGNTILRNYVEEYVYCSLLKKRRYGFQNDEMNRIINEVDSFINEKDINALLTRFGTRAIKAIEESLDETKSEQQFEIKDSVIVGAQLGTKGSKMKFKSRDITNALNAIAQSK